MHANQLCTALGEMATIQIRRYMLPMASFFAVQCMDVRDAGVSKAMCSVSQEHVHVDAPFVVQIS